MSVSGTDLEEAVQACSYSRWWVAPLGIPAESLTKDDNIRRINNL